MTEANTNQPQINRQMTLIGLFGCSAAYSFWLSTKKGKQWADEQTWVTVAAGVGLTTAFIAMEDRKAAYLNFIYFFVAGIPIILRSLLLQLERWEKAIQKYTGS